MITKGKVMIEPIVAKINEEGCSGCRICNNMCPYNAIEYDEVKKVSRILTSRPYSKGCGTCVSVSRRTWPVPLGSRTLRTCGLSA